MTSPQNFPGMPSMPPPFRPPGGPPGGQPGFPPGGQPGFPPPGGQPGGQPGFPPGTPGSRPPSGGPPPGQMPTGAPPSFAPAMPLGNRHGASGISSCLFAYTYIWTFEGNNFWFYPIVVTRDQVMGYRWSSRNNRWSFRILSRNNIWSFQCFR